MNKKRLKTSNQWKKIHKSVNKKTKTCKTWTARSVMQTQTERVRLTGLYVIFTQNKSKVNGAWIYLALGFSFKIKWDISFVRAS